MRFAARKDSTQSEIVKGLREHGYLVDIRSEYGKPDLDVRNPTWRLGIVVQMESKTPNRKNGSYKQTKSEAIRRVKQRERCAIWGVPYVTSSQQALDWLTMNYLRSSVPLPGGKQ